MANENGKFTKEEFKEIVNDQIEVMFETSQQVEVLFEQARQEPRMGMVSGLLALTFIQQECAESVPADEVDGCKNLLAAIALVGQLKLDQYDALEKALKVMVLDDKISGWLEANDPQALKQAHRALHIKGFAETVE